MIEKWSRANLIGTGSVETDWALLVYSIHIEKRLGLEELSCSLGCMYFKI